jgi:hypothetical protein
MEVIDLIKRDPDLENINISVSAKYVDEVDNRFLISK